MKSKLFTPGPTKVPGAVLNAVGKQVLHHRSPEFSEKVRHVQDELGRLLSTHNDTLLFTCSGTGMMEAAVANLLSRGDKAMCLVNGVFGQRWADICTAYGVEAVCHSIEWGKSVDPSDLDRALDRHPDAKVVFATHSETSTGALNDVKALGAIAGKHDVVMAVDATSSVGVHELRMDEWGIDVIIAGTQKALMTPPGLAFVALNGRAWSLVSDSDLPTFYFDFTKTWKRLQKKGQTPFTTAVSLVYGLEVALAMMEEEGWENVYARHAAMGAATRAAVSALGFRVLPEHPADGLTVAVCPEGIDGNKIVRVVDDEFGVRFAGGQEKLSGRVFRIGHMGGIRERDLAMAVSALERALVSMGHDIEIGKGLTALEEVLLKRTVAA
ncbi:MAG: aminotransferase class V-fold PLP-dependent enzyme [Candidatus Eisenbacteria bacterium]|nr:aminotransferase class V-fold PLP-dependent enzyme [Candidatus Eisenbacteria bacterium]